MDAHIRSLITMGEFTSQTEYIRTLIREDMAKRVHYTLPRETVEDIKASLPKIRSDFDEGKGKSLEEVKQNTKKFLEQLQAHS